ncbi:MAG: glutathione peroxidase [Bacillota bacterium]
MKFHDFEIINIEGVKLKMSKFTNKVLLIVNTATECNSSYQLEEFQSLYNSYKSQDFAVLGFPSNSFQKEPNDNAEIQNKCATLYNITFPLFEKISVKGKDIHPLFNWLINQKRGFLTKSIKYNYTKFLIDREGNVVKRYSPFVKPDAIESDIKNLL